MSDFWFVVHARISLMFSKCASVHRGLLERRMNMTALPVFWCSQILFKIGCFAHGRYFARWRARYTEAQLDRMTQVIQKHLRDDLIAGGPIRVRRP